MPGLIPENLLEDILSRVDIVEVISGYIPLKRAGRNFKTNCPFHHEKSPSFMVSPDKQIYHCFGCGESGNAFKFLMRHERLEFPEAVQMLARKAGVELPQEQKQDSAAVSLATKLYKINELAANFYAQHLNSPDAAQAKKYLLERGITQETISSLKLGAAPDKWDGLINYLRQKNIGFGLLEKAGLVLAKDNGGYYDRFRNRIIFPILDIRSRPLGFGARVLDKSLPKYVNSPETPVYIKGRHLYGLNLAKDAIRDNDFVAVVEGYMDFIVPYQAGVKSIVASLGTALTTEQARLLKRYTHNVVMIYDADLAGQLATLRSLDIFIEEEMNVKVVSLPQGLDPDLFVRKYGADGFNDLIKKADNLFDYKFKILKTQYKINEIEGKARVASEMLATVSKFKNAILRSEYTKKLGEALGLSEEILIQELKNIKPQVFRSEPLIAKENVVLTVNPTEKLLIKLMLEETKLIGRIRQSLKADDFQDARVCRIVSTIFDFMDQGRSIHPSSLVNHLEDDACLQMICESAMPTEASDINKEMMVDDCILRMKSQKFKLKKEFLHDQIKIAQAEGDENKLASLMREFQELVKINKT